ncbi:MAG: HD domain-containing protein [archaeon]
MRYVDASFEDLKLELGKYNSEYDAELLKKTFDFINKQYAEKKRESGKPFISHLLNVSTSLAEQHMDFTTICAGLTHDFLDNNLDQKKTLENLVGKDAANISEEAAKISEVIGRNFGKLNNDKLRLIILILANDIRTIFVEIAGALDNLRNTQNMPKQKTYELAKLTEEVYAPIAHKLGLYEISWELRDLSFKILNPEAYYSIKKEIVETREKREKVIKEIIVDLNEKLKQQGIEATIYGRPKSFYSIFKKTQSQGKKVSDLADLLGIRVICNSVEECYTILGIIHGAYNQFPHFDDYIAHPKSNRYRSIHTVIGWGKNKVEIQIRTYDMHQDAEDGLAAHWQYKKFWRDPFFDKKLILAKQIMNWKAKSNMLESLKIEFGTNKIFVVTPKNDVVLLPAGSTALDFAFEIHTDLGSKCKKVLVNKKPVGLDYELVNGDAVEILKGEKDEIKKQWINFVKTDRARMKIRKKLGMSLGGIKQKEDKMKILNPYEKIRLAKCCNPLPGDIVVSYKTTKRKATIHRKDCTGIKSDISKLAPFLLGGLKEKTYSTKIALTAVDYPHLLPDILKIIERNKSLVKTTKANYESGNLVKIELELDMPKSDQLKQILSDINRIPIVKQAERI